MIHTRKWSVAAYLMQVPPFRHGWCWHVGVSQLWIFWPCWASPIMCSSLELTWSSMMQPTKPVTLPMLACSLEGNGTPPRKMGPNTTWVEKKIVYTVLHIVYMSYSKYSYSKYRTIWCPNLGKEYELFEIICTFGLNKFPWTAMLKCMHS